MSVLNSIKKIISNAKNYGYKRSTSKIKYCVIHYTSNDGDTDENNGKYFKNNVVYASAHYFVDSNSITQSVEDNVVAYSVGGGRQSSKGGKYFNKCINSNSISIELCDDNRNGVVYPSAKTIENAIELATYLCKKYKINPETNLIRHFDVNGKSCPAYWTNDEKWKKEFKNKVIAKYKGTATATINKTANKITKFKEYLVVISSPDGVANMRQKPDASSKFMGSLKNGNTKYTVIGESNGWVKLKNGNWINKKLVKKASEVQATAKLVAVGKKATTTAKKTTTGQTYKITADVLNVREGAGTQYKVKTTIKKNEVYTIIETKKVGKSTWGKLKSGAGWINLSYAKKI